MQMSWFLFKKYLFSGRAGSLIRLISWISLLGVCVGLMSLVVVVAVMSGFHEVIRARLLGLEPHVVITFPIGTTSDQLLGQAQSLQSDGKKDHLEEVVPVESQDLIVRTLDGVFSGAIAKGYPASDLERYMKRTDRLNREALEREDRAKHHTKPDDQTGLAATQFVPETTELKEREVALGADLARSLGVLEGDQVLLIPPEGLLAPKGELPVYERVTVVARVSTRVADLDSKLVLYDSAKSLRRMVRSPSRERLIEIRLDSPNRADAYKAQMQKAFPKARVETWKDRNEALFFALKMEKLVMTIFLGLSGLITSFSIVSVISLLVSQKRREIGMMMALGMTARRVQRVFVGIGFLLSFAGVTVGVSLGLLICTVIDRFPIPLLPDIYYDSTIPVQVTPELVGIVIGLAFVVAVMSAFLPSRGLSKLTPAETFRLRR